MNKRHNNTLRKNIDLVKFFKEPISTRQKHYEAVRAVIIDKISVEEASKRFDYKTSTIYSLIKDAKSGRLELFPEVKKGPKQRRTSIIVQEKIIKYRRKFLSSLDIGKELESEGINVSTRTIERILKDKGFRKLKKRTNKELGKTKKNKIIPNRSQQLNFNKLNSFKVDCPSVGIFFFLPYIIESGILSIVKKCKLPTSSRVNSTSAALSMLLLKLLGNKRLSHIEAYDKELGLGIFSGLNVLPKSVYMNSYSCLTSESMLLNFQEKLIGRFREIYPELYSGNFINLDFHSIPHYGDKSEMEKVWCGAKGKTLKGANTVFAQDSKNNTILYSRADILRKEESLEVKKFISYWRKQTGGVSETLVFDCKFTKYSILDELTDDNINFITLRKRTKKIIKKTLDIPKEKWSKIKLSIPKRKYQKISVYEEKIILNKCKNSFRQIIVKDHGRANPTYIITNNKELSLKKILEVYAKRWHIENKLSELISFFNLNALSSPLMIRIHFDILWSIIADTLYHRFSRDLKRFEHCLAPTIFRKFINMPGKIIYDGNQFKIKIRKRSFTPILMDVEKLKKPFKVPWLKNKTIEIVWTP
jgi:transposase